MATYAKKDLVRAMSEHCRECNDVSGEWHEGNDCTGKSCKLYPFRPGSGPGHAERTVNAVRNTEGLRRAHASGAKKRRKGVGEYPDKGVSL